ncbi:ATP-binding protein [Actinocorallia sp. API 0066]|uniref:ATP-binding protein n=1 Tax=Actinocorallia sp. API 0066 TaxID=2896846 RepID=UPI001E376F45|nr:ATP-binding protein [Actinocorallia sp. API 0066]MCD0452416.1 ATP-binding protein [Actinocorallia sp. API 0066]
MFDGEMRELVEARRFVRSVGAGHGALYRAVLVMNELATNAILHTRSGDEGGLFVVEVEVGADGMKVGVVDMGADQEPVVVDRGVEALDGRGLELVGRIAEKWGFEEVRVGRRVWAVVPAEDVREWAGKV